MGDHNQKPSQEGGYSQIHLADLKGPNFIICKAGWCGFCKKLQQDINTNKIIGDAVKKLEIKLIDSETQTTDVDKQIMQRLNIQGFPHVCYFDDTVLLGNQIFNSNILWNILYILKGMKNTSDYIQSLAPIEAYIYEQPQLGQHTGYRLFGLLYPAMQYLFLLQVARALNINISGSLEKSEKYLKKYVSNNKQFYDMLVQKKILDAFEQIQQLLNKNDMKKNPVLRYYLLSVINQSARQIGKSPLLKQNDDNKAHDLIKQANDALQKVNLDSLVKNQEAFTGFVSQVPQPQQQQQPTKIIAKQVEDDYDEDLQWWTDTQDKHLQVTLSPETLKDFDWTL